jgi:hypothetical protein
MRIPRRLFVLLVVAAVGCAVFGQSASAASSPSNAVIADCYAHPGGLTGHYTATQLRTALQVMPANIKEYTSCQDVINRALLAVLSRRTSGSGGSAGGSGSFLPTPVIVILVLVVLVALTFGAIAIRRRRGGGGLGAA